MADKVPNNNRILELSAQIGEELVARYGVVPVLSDEDVKEMSEGAELSFGAIPKDRVEEVASDVTMVVAEILQAWLNAGSEREVTNEELMPMILEHFEQWTN